MENNSSPTKTVDLTTVFFPCYLFAIGIIIVSGIEALTAPTTSL